MCTVNQSVWEKWERVGKIRMLARVTLNGLADRVVTRGPPVVDPWVKATFKVKVRVYLLCVLPFYQAYCTLVVCYCYITGGVLISFRISRSTCVSIASTPLPNN